MSKLLFRRSTGNFSGHNQEELEVTEESLGPLLEEDSTLVEFFNAFLALLMFPVRLHYNPDTGCFEEFKHKLADDAIDNNVKRATGLKRFSFFKSTIDDKGRKIGYYVKFLDKSTGFDWVKKNRLPLFLKSELFAEYKLARTLSVAQTQCLMNFMIDSLNLKKTAFDEGSSPQYRTQRNRGGTLPGLAEFQERMQLLEDGLDSNSEDVCSDSASSVSDLEEIEFSEINMKSRRRERTMPKLDFVDSDCQSMTSSFDGNYENELLCGTNQPPKFSDENQVKDDSNNDFRGEDFLHRRSPNINQKYETSAFSQKDIFHEETSQNEGKMKRKSSDESSLENKRNMMTNFGIASVVGALKNELESIRIDSDGVIENGNMDTGLRGDDSEENDTKFEQEGAGNSKIGDEISTTRNILQEFISDDIRAVSAKENDTKFEQEGTENSKIRDEIGTTRNIPQEFISDDIRAVSAKENDTKVEQEGAGNSKIGDEIGTTRNTPQEFSSDDIRVVSAKENDTKVEQEGAGNSKIGDEMGTTRNIPQEFISDDIRAVSMKENDTKVEQEGTGNSKIRDEIGTTRNIPQEFISDDIRAVSAKENETNSNQDSAQCKTELDALRYAFEDNTGKVSSHHERSLTASGRDTSNKSGTSGVTDSDMTRKENEISKLNDDDDVDSRMKKETQRSEMASLDNSLSNQFSFDVKMMENGQSSIEESLNHWNQESLRREPISHVTSDHESLNHESRIADHESLNHESRIADHESLNHEVEEAKESISSLAVIQLSQKRHSMPNEKQLLESVLTEEGLLQDDVFSNEPLPRRPSLPTNTLGRRLSSLSMSSTLEGMNELLANEMLDLKSKKSQDALRKLLEDSESDDDDDENDVSNNRVARKPIDIASKEGMDAFKMFLVDTPGEKLFLLWIEIERLKTCNDLKERTGIIKEIRQRFFRSGATFELTTETLKSWNITSFGNVDFKTLTEIQGHVLKPLQIYWCARFTLHQKRQHVSASSEYVTDDHTCMNTRCSTHQREMSHVPQRPNTCFPGFRAKSNRSRKEIETIHSCKIQQNDTLEPSIDSVKDLQPPSGVEASRTKSRIRSKSAHPRLIGTSNPKEINLSQQQLQIITTIDESCGYRPAPNYNYKSDAATMDEKDNVRLYIQPAPPPDCKVSTVIRTIHIKEEERKSEETQERERTSLMDSLVECLLHEKHSGQFFYNHLLNKDNKLWTDCYHFWRALQDYNEHFFCDTFNPDLIKQQAGFIFSTFIVSGSKQSIHCDVKLQVEIHKRLDPPYEELFDGAEEHALRLLADAYDEIFQQESVNYDELKKTEKLKYLDVRKRIKRPSHKPKEKAENDENGDDDCDDVREKISIEEMNAPLPVATDGVTFDSFIRNKQDVDHFKEFLQRTNNKGLKDLLAWTEMENFRRSSRRHNQRNEVAKSVNTNWLNEEYFFGSSSPATKEAQAEVRKFGNNNENIERPPSPMILEAQKYVRARIERRWLVLFKETSVYQGRHKENNITEMVEDMIMKRRLQRSEAAWKILNSRWVSGSRDVVALRQFLMDPEKCNRFRKFLSLKGELMDHNVYFWLEIQKYKDLCHRHVQEFIIKSKVQAIVDVFIKSAIPPELQIDVPIEIAERLYEKASGRVPQHGPYLFREAQTTVFRIMFSYWKEFVAFKASIEEEKLGQHLEELDKKHKAQVKAKRMVTERRRLARIAHEKRKKERVEEERSKERDRMSSRFERASTLGREKALSSITEDEDITVQTRSFSYSKFTIEQELQSLEQRMRDEGYTVDEITEGELTQSYFTSDRKTIRRTSGMISDDQKSISVMSVRRGKKTSDILSKLTRGSLIHEPIFESTEAVFSKKNKRTSEGKSREKQSSGSVISSKEGNSANRDLLSRKHKLLLKIQQKHDDAKSVGRISSVSDVGKLNRSASTASLMPGPQRTSNKSGTVLTKKSLREFSKSPQGKPLDGPLPLINITKASTATSGEKRPKSTQSITSTRDARVKRPLTSKLRKNENANQSTAFVAKIIVT